MIDIIHTTFYQPEHTLGIIIQQVFKCLSNILIQFSKHNLSLLVRQWSHFYKLFIVINNTIYPEELNTLLIFLNNYKIGHKTIKYIKEILGYLLIISVWVNY